MGRTTKNQLGPCLQKFVFFIVCLGGFFVFFTKRRNIRKMHNCKSVVLGAETFAEFFFFATLQKLYLFQVLKPYENKLDGY